MKNFCLFTYWKLEAVWRDGGNVRETGRGNGMWLKLAHDHVQYWTSVFCCLAVTKNETIRCMRQRMCIVCTASHCHIFSSPLFLLEFILHAKLTPACMSYKSLILFTCWVVPKNLKLTNQQAFSLLQILEHLRAIKQFTTVKVTMNTNRTQNNFEYIAQATKVIWHTSL